ncbi:DUF1223 domain-containing protein [Devosia albogilva]|uniref:DUF1223 domain-containing protein n=1 Tax=Devosia albogilva TaxID=429726 RepID=A0ABW5QJD9_9HYPH
MTSRLPLTAALAATAVLALCLPSAAEELRVRPKAVVELFTSQGCAQCPPADALLTALAEEDDVVALAYHVDYWDYVGWTDTFGSPEFSDRQRAYAKSWNSSRIFTPQMVINGAKGVVGSRRNEVHGAVDGANLPLAMDLALVGDGNMLKVTIPPDPALEDAMVWLVTYRDRAEVSIDSGENAGKSMVYTQVVAERQLLGMWEAATGAEHKLPLAELLDNGEDGIAILVQQEHSSLPGPILGAAAYEP